MKSVYKAILIILCGSLLITGCKKEINIPVEELPPVTVEWTNIEKNVPIEIPYSSVNYRVQSFPYTIEEDLSNIENSEDFPEFSSEQIKLLIENGFIIMPKLEEQFASLPKFISADLLLHQYYLLYNENLSYMEKNILYEKLKTLTNDMLEKSIVVDQLIKDGSLKNISQENIVFFLVAKMLMNGNSYVDLELDESIIELAKKEYYLINEEDGNQYSPLFDKQLDYSQFDAKGHYSKNEVYERYFKARIWYGFSPMQLMVNNGRGLNVDNVQKTLLMTYTAFLNKEGEKTVEIWKEIDSSTNLFSEENLNIIDIRDIIVHVFGEDLNINDIGNKSYFAALFEEIRKLPDSKMSMILNNKIEIEKQFGFMSAFGNLKDENFIFEPSKLDENYQKFGLESKMPFFMLNEEWHKKSINTIARSFSEFKKDENSTIQPVEEGETQKLCEDLCYIEPNIEMYSKLLWFMQYRTANLEDRALLSEELLSKNKAYIKMVEELIHYSVKELANEDFTESEKEIVGNIELEAVEEFDSIYVVVPIEGKLYLTQGSVYSFN